MEATHITSNPRSEKLGTINEDDDGATHLTFSASIASILDCNWKICWLFSIHSSYPANDSSAGVCNLASTFASSC